MAKIGIFGGTFSPFHLGHLAIIKKALEKLDKVIIVPTVINYYRPGKRSLFSFDDRVRIILEMTAGFSGSVTVDSVERDKDSTWRTVDTLLYFKKLYPNDELYFIMGEDSYSQFKTWFKYEDILRLAKLLVANRGEIKADPEVPFEELNIGKGFQETSATAICDKLIEELIDTYIADKEWYNSL